jgi:hypothetical protein
MIDWPETAEIGHGRASSQGPAMPNFRRLREAAKKALPGAAGQIFGLHFFYARRHPTVCCSLVRHRADVGSEIKNRASIPLCPFITVTVFAFAEF